MYRYLLLCVFLASGFCSCIDDETDFLNADLPGPSQVNLMDLEAGQTSVYLGYQQDCDSNSFSWTGDTLVTRILEVDGETFMSEQLTPGSPSNPGDKKGISYPIRSKNGVVSIPDRELSKLFGLYGSDEINLKPDKRISLLQSGCVIQANDAIFEGNEVGYIPVFTAGDIDLYDKTAVSAGSVTNVNTYLLYDSYQLHVSHQVFSGTFQGVPLNGVARGWVLLDE